MKKTPSLNQVIITIAALVVLLLTSVAIGSWLIDKRDDKTATSATASTLAPVPTPPTEVQNTTSSPDANQP